MKLVIGNKNYSSWSLRPWLLMDGFAVEFEEVNESLRAEGLSERLRQHSEVAKVPVLINDEMTVWDSLAICEYVSEQKLAGKGWPSAIEERAIARSICAEFHSGLADLRNELPMNCRASRKVELSSAAQKDIQRVDDIWSRYARQDDSGALRLFGQFSVADCFFAPVVMRFKTYDIGLSTKANAYAKDMFEHPSLKKWLAQALEETEILLDDEAGIEI